MGYYHTNNIISSQSCCFLSGKKKHRAIRGDPCDFVDLANVCISWFINPIDQQLLTIVINHRVINHSY